MESMIRMLDNTSRKINTKTCFNGSHLISHLVGSTAINCTAVNNPFTHNQMRSRLKSKRFLRQTKPQYNRPAKVIWIKNT